MDYHPPCHNVNNTSKVKNEEYMVIGNEEGNNDQIDSINQGLKTSSLANSIPKVMKNEPVVINNKERNEDQTDFKNQGIRTSTRPKRSPNIRSDDFLWV
jgi:ethanolamine ammonia-lyase large subunit